MGFNKLKTSSNTPKQTATEKVVEKEVEVVTQVTNEAPAKTAEPVKVAVKETSKALSVFGGGNASAALLVVTEMADSAPIVFPVLTLAGGNAGGMFTVPSFVPQEIADQLPQGKRAIECVFMGYRTELAAWPVGFSDKKDGDKPSWSLAVSCADGDAARLVAGAAKAYQYTKGVNKKAWDFADSGFGHLRPILQVMVYLPAVDDIVVIQTPAHYTSWTSSMENLKKLMDPKTSQLTQAPCQIRPISTPKTIGGTSVTEHVIDFNVVATDSGKQWYEKYAAFIQQAAADEETREKIENWVNCADRPMTDDLRTLLSRAGTFKP